MSATCFLPLSSTLRLSAKYLVPHLQVLCVNRLALDWPATLDTWDYREKAATERSGKYNPREFTPHPVDIIHLVLDMGCDAFSNSDSPKADALIGTRILCSAFYDLSRYGPSRILTSISNSKTFLSAYTVPAPILVRSLQGREAAQKYMSDFITKELVGREPSLQCAYRNPAGLVAPVSLPHSYMFSPQACRESFYFIMLNLLRSIGGIACGRDADPLFTLVQAVEMMERRDFTAGPGQPPLHFLVNHSLLTCAQGQGKTCALKICIECKADFKQCADNAREEVWGMMPTWFGLIDV